MGTDDPLVVLEPPILGNGRDHLVFESATSDEAVEDSKISNEEDLNRLQKQPGVFTRCELSIRRVETHLLDPSPISLQQLADSTSTADMKLKLTPKVPTTAANKTTTEDNKNSLSETLSSRNIRVAVVGNVDAGKSTLIGTLTTSCLDDGRGKSRTSIMKHRHEIETGRTSTASSHILGFSKNGEPVSTKDKLRR